jgi:tight adherence protein C
MVTLYLMAVTCGMLILIVMLAIGNVVDHQAKARSRKRFHLFKEERPPISPGRRILGILDDLKPPRMFYQWVDEQTLTWSGLSLSHQQFAAAWWLLSLAGLVVGLILAGLGSPVALGRVVGFCLILIPAVGPYLILQYRIRRREREVEKTLPDFLDMLTFTVEAGLGFVPALQRVSKGVSGVLGEELQRVLVRFDLGFPRQEALLELTQRIPSSDVEHFVEAILISERLGTSLARTLRVQANLLRLRRRQRAEVKAQTAPIRIIPALVFFFLPGLLLIYLAPPIINFLLRR